jgi:nitroreductase
MTHHSSDDRPAFDSIPLSFTSRPPAEMAQRAREFLDEMRMRRSVRHFSADPVPHQALLDCIAAAGQAPSGANKQPWSFVVVTDAGVKKRIREAAETEERAHYGGRASERWLADLEPLGTDADKPFLEIAPALVVVFAQRHGATAAEQHYYVSESVGIATGVLIAALHHAGFATLTHTPSPMKFLAEILGRPAGERPYLLIPVGFPADGCRVPNIKRKRLEDYCTEV